MIYTCKPLREHLVDLGKARLYYAVDGPLEADVNPVHWDGLTPLYLKELALTEGEMQLEANAEYSDLKLDEYTGPIPIKSYYKGEAPVLTAGVYAVDPALLSILSPTGTAGAGFESQQPAALRTIVALPEILFRGAVGQPLGSLEFEAGQWLFEGDPLPESADRFLGQILWMWSARPDRVPRVYRQADGGSGLAQCTFSLIQDLSLPLPEGAQVYWIGDPADAGIDIEGGS